LVMVTLQSLKRACGFQADFKTNCSLNEIEGPWWILESKIQRPDGHWGAFGLRIRIGGREVHLERPGVDTKGIVSFRHLLKLPLGECTIRLDWIEEGMTTQKILQKTCHIRGVSRVDQEKILTHSVDGQTDMTVMPKYGFWRGLEKKIRNHKKAIYAKFNKKFKPVSSERVKPLLTSSELNRKSLGRRLFVDITLIVGSDRKTGIERVTQSVLVGLITSQTHGMEIIPVHSVENQQGFFVAKPTILRKGRWERGPGGEVAVQPLAGDVFLGLVLNHHGICENASLLAQWADEGVSILFYVYDLLPIQYPQFWPLEAQADILHHEWLSIVTSFDEVICISETTAKRCGEFMEGKYPPRFCYKSRLKKPPLKLRSKKVKISAIALGHDFDAKLLSRGLPKNANELLKAFRAKRTFLMVGTLEPRKGYRQMLEAFEQLWRQGEDIQLVIVGRNGWLMEDFVAGLERHAERDQKLFWLTEVSDEFLAKIYQSCSCLLAASIDEGLGLPLIEAMHRGKPLLARDIEVFRETGDLNVRYFKDNKDEIVDCIRKTRQKAGPKNKSLSKLKSWEMHVQQLEEKINNAVTLKKATYSDQPAIKMAVDLKGLTPHAKRIYTDLNNALERKRGEVRA
jgi:glycosyltransferase involved in cell wall biosynthesis